MHLSKTDEVLKGFCVGGSLEACDRRWTGRELNGSREAINYGICWRVIRVTPTAYPQLIFVQIGY